MASEIAELGYTTSVAEAWLAADEAMIAMAPKEGLLVEVDSGG